MVQLFILIFKIMFTMVVTMEDPSFVWQQQELQEQELDSFILNETNLHINI
jgi:hypothetical protein